MKCEYPLVSIAEAADSLTRNWDPLIRWTKHKALINIKYPARHHSHITEKANY